MILQLQDLACGSVWQDCGHDQGAEVTGGSEDRNIPSQPHISCCQFARIPKDWRASELECGAALICI